MAATMQSLGIDKLSREERWQLALEIWQSLDQIPSDILSSRQWSEVQECIEADDNDPDGGYPWEEVKAELLAEIASHAVHHHGEGQESHS